MKKDIDKEAKKKAYEKLISDYISANRIKYFGKYDEFLDKQFPDLRLKGPNPLQEELLSAWNNPKYKVFVYSGGNRIGKTTILIIISFSIMFGEWLWSGEKIKFSHNQPRKLRLVGQDWEKHIKAVLEPEMHRWWPKDRKLKTKKNNQGVDALWIDEKTGSTLEIMSNMQESKLHEGWFGDFVGYDEPPTRAIRVANSRGLVDRMGREMFSMTLLSEPWIDREVIKARNEDGTPDTSVFAIDGDIWQNVGFGLTKEGVDQFAKTLTDEEKQSRLYGKPSYLSGLVYPQFSREKHLIERFKIPLDYIVDIGIDIHPREKQAVLFIATDPREYRYACFEIWENGDGTQIAEEIVRIVKTHHLRVGSILIDPLSKADSNVDKDEVADILEGTTYRKIEDVLRRYNLPLEAAVKAKTSGILEVRNHLKGPNNLPSLFFFDDMKRTVWEIEGYMYDKETQKPVDKDDHMMENLYRLLLKNTKWTPPIRKNQTSQSTNWKLV